MTERREPIRALATITLDAGVLEQLGPQAIDRLAELVEARIVDGRRGGGRRLGSGLLSVAAVAEDAGVSTSLVYREIEDLSHTYPRDENPKILDWLMGA